MVAGLATLQDGHACGGEQHGSRSNYGNRGTSRRHTITLVVLIILISGQILVVVATPEV